MSGKYREANHQAMIYRHQRVRHRAYNLFEGMEAVDRQIPKDDPRFENLKAIVNRYFDGIVDLFKLEDQIDDELTRLAQEVGK